VQKYKFQNINENGPVCSSLVFYLVFLPLLAAINFLLLLLETVCTGDARWGQGCLGPVESKLFKLRSKHYLDKSKSSSSSRPSSSSSSTAKKLPSGPPLFEFAGADCVASHHGPVYDFARRVKLPPLPASSLPSGGGAEHASAEYENYGKSGSKSNKKKKGTSIDKAVNNNATTVPAYIVINMQIPLEAKSLFGGSKQKSPAKGGKGGSSAVSSSVPAINAVYYFRITPLTAKHMLALDEELQGGKQAKQVPPTCRLLHNW